MHACMHPLRLALVVRMWTNSLVLSWSRLVYYFSRPATRLDQSSLLYNNTQTKGRHACIAFLHSAVDYAVPSSSRRLDSSPARRFLKPRTLLYSTLASYTSLATVIIVIRG